MAKRQQETINTLWQSINTKSERIKELERINKIYEFEEKLHEELILKYDNLQIEYDKLKKNINLLKMEEIANKLKNNLIIDIIKFRLHAENDIWALDLLNESNKPEWFNTFYNELKNQSLNEIIFKNEYYFETKNIFKLFENLINEGN